MKKVVILGSGGFGREVLPFLLISNEYKIVGFTDSQSSLKGKLINAIPILGDDSILKKLIKEDVKHAFVAIGEINRRKYLFEKICKIGFRSINIIHPSAVIAPDVSFGQGIVIYPNVTINANVRVRNSVLINSNVSIGHDTEVGNFVNINPGANIAGKVHINDCAFLGIGCTVLEKIKIGDSSIVGAGALVRKDVEPNSIVYGVPARPKVQDSLN